MSLRGFRDARPRHHAVQFYRSDESLCTTAAGFLAEGLILGQPCIAIATESHRNGIREHLSGRYIDCARAIRAGELVLLDAAATLDLFMVRDLPEWDLFEGNARRLLNQVLDGRPQKMLRVYGEGVDVLWQRGQSEAAVMLETFWNQLNVEFNLAILCGYAVSSFHDNLSQLERVCAQHSHMVAGERNVMSFPTRATASD